MSNNGIQAVSLDLDNTLWHAEPVLVLAEKALYNWLADNTPELVTWLTKERLLAYRNHLIETTPGLKFQVSEIRQRVLRQALQDVGYDANASLSLAKAAFEVFYRARQRVSLFEPVIPVLEALTSQYRVISITNGNANPDIIGLSRFFEFSMSAESEGVPKPEADIFHRALSKLGLQPHQVVHVGDHPDDDVAGAASVGMKTVWIDIPGVGYGPDAKPAQADACISCFSQLPAAITKLVVTQAR